MNDSLTVAATLLVVGPIVATAGLARPALFRAWTAPREEPRAGWVAAGPPTDPAETLIGAAIGGLFTAFMLVTSASLVAIGLTLTLSGGVAAPVPSLATLIAAGAFVGSTPPREVIPAVIYL